MKNELLKTDRTLRIKMYTLLDFFNDSNGYFQRASLDAEREDDAFTAEIILLRMNDFHLLFEEKCFNPRNLFNKRYTNFTFYKAKGMKYNCLERLSSRYKIDKNNVYGNKEILKLFEEWVTTDECQTHFRLRIKELKKALLKARFNKILKKRRTVYINGKIDAYNSFLANI